jgi:two-component system chemotaxis sensor kinase CheA
MKPSELITTFLRETEELIETLEQGLVDLEDSAEPGEIINALFRAAHTVKGNSGMVGANACVHFTHVTENVLAHMRDGALLPSRDVIDLLLGAVDVIRGFAAVIATGDLDAAPAGHDEKLAALEELLGGEVVPRTEALDDVVRTFRIVVRLPAERAPTEPDARSLIDEIAALGELVSVAPAPETPGALEFRLELRAAVRRADVEAVVLFADAELEIESVVAPPAPTPEAATPPAGTPTAATPTSTAPSAATPTAAAKRSSAQATIRVDPRQLDDLLDLVGEMAIAIALARRAVHDPAAPRAERVEAIESIDRLGRDMQERVMRVRMVPVRETFERMRRPVRDVARELGKEVVFETEGDDTAMDRKLLDELADPLKHLVRNAVGHGLESPEERLARGKPAAGRVVLRAGTRDGQAVIEIADDGRGIDPAKVLAIAKKRGIVAEDARLSETEIHQLLFAAGFSTAEKVDQISGRGVGLDVVRQNVEKLRGRVTILSELGKGTTFRISLPLTLAVIDGMSVRVAGETLSVPLVEVDELLDPGATKLRTIEGRAEYVDVRGEMLPVVRLERLFSLSRGESDAAPARPSVLVVHTERRRFGLLVDGVVGMTRNVFKPLDRSFELCAQMTQGWKRPGGVGGATILGDGTVGYILDVHGIDGMAFG